MYGALNDAKIRDINKRRKKKYKRDLKNEAKRRCRVLTGRENPFHNGMNPFSGKESVFLPCQQFKERQCENNMSTNPECKQLQDQCRFEDENGDWITFDDVFSTNHNGKYKKHGTWVRPVFPSNRSLQGSPMTPYIFDDRVNFEDVSDAIRRWYDTLPDRRVECGLDGREFCLNDGLTSKQMADKMVEMMNFLFNNPKEKRPRYTLSKVESVTYKEMGIV